MNIEKDVPFLGHTKIDYDECCAKLILEELFPDRYTDLVLDDKPDIQGDGVGIEVTIADEEKNQEATKNWLKARSSKDERVRAYSIERMKQLGVEYVGGIQLWPTLPVTFDLTKKAIEKKINKLRSGKYKYFPRYELFVFTDTWYEERVVAEARKNLFAESVSRYYQTVYVLSQGYNLQIFETKSGEYKNLVIDTVEQSNRNERAWQMVVEAEKMECK